MSEYIVNLQNGQSLGIVYCDVTGLKQTNDRKGHDAGDKLLIDACECLKKSFGEYGLFRVGGDELLAICAEIREDALWQGVEQLKKNLRNKSVHMAVGSIWEKDSFNGVNKLIAWFTIAFYHSEERQRFKLPLLNYPLSKSAEQQDVIFSNIPKLAQYIFCLKYHRTQKSFLSFLVLLLFYPFWLLMLL